LLVSSGCKIITNHYDSFRGHGKPVKVKTIHYVIAPGAEFYLTEAQMINESKIEAEVQSSDSNWDGYVSAGEAKRNRNNSLRSAIINNLE
jgi:hypothetical protein